MPNIKTIKQAKKAGYQVFRQIRVFYRHPDGYLCELPFEAHEQGAYSWRKMPNRPPIKDAAGER